MLHVMLLWKRAAKIKAGLNARSGLQHGGPEHGHAQHGGPEHGDAQHGHTKVFPIRLGHRDTDLRLPCFWDALIDERGAKTRAGLNE